MARDMSRVGNKRMVMDGHVKAVVRDLGLEDAGEISQVSDARILGVSGVGRATLRKLREYYPVRPMELPKTLRVRILPNRGVGGVGLAGDEVEVGREYAEELLGDGYVELV